MISARGKKLNKYWFQVRVRVQGFGRTTLIQLCICMCAHMSLALLLHASKEPMSHSPDLQRTMLLHINKFIHTLCKQLEKHNEDEAGFGCIVIYFFFLSSEELLQRNYNTIAAACRCYFIFFISSGEQIKDLLVNNIYLS